MISVTWRGKYHRGAMREHREAKRIAAEQRNSRTPIERRRITREGPPERRPR